jgi:ribonuclease VapC
VTTSVLDTSALLALLDEEAGADIVRAVIFHSTIGTVTLAETYTKLAERGGHGREALTEILFAVGNIVPFTEEHAEVAGILRSSTAHAGLSLGDRACLALGISLHADVYTADRIWAELDVPCKVRLIR